MEGGFLLQFIATNGPVMPIRGQETHHFLVQGSLGRTALLDRLESQLKKGPSFTTRLLFAFNVSDDRKVQRAIDQRVHGLEEDHSWSSSRDLDLLKMFFVFFRIGGCTIGGAPLILLYWWTGGHVFQYLAAA